MTSEVCKQYRPLCMLGLSNFRAQNSQVFICINMKPKSHQLIIVYTLEIVSIYDTLSDDRIYRPLVHGYTMKMLL